MLDALDGRLVMAARDDRADRHFLFNEAFENIVQHLVGRQRILVLLVLAQFRRGRLGENVRGNDHAIRPLGARRLPAVAQVGKAENLHLVEVLDRVVAAIHVAIERGIAHRHLALVAGGHDHRTELVREGHQQGAARPRLQVFLGHITWMTGKKRRQHRFQPLHRRGDGEDIVADAEGVSAVARIPEAFFRRVAVGQHDGVNALRAQRIRCHGRADRRINPAGKPEDHPGEAVLLDIILQPQHAGRIIRLWSFDDEMLLASADPPACAIALERGHGKMLDEGRELECERAIGVDAERGAIEDELVLPTDLVEIHHRQAAFLHAGHGDVEADIGLVALIGRAIRHEQDLGARLGEAFDDIAVPDVLADRNPDPEPAHSDGARQGAGIKHALFVEDTVIRQINLEADAENPATIQRGHRIVQFVAFTPWQAHQHGRPAIRCLARQRIERLTAGLFKRRLGHHVLGRIARQEQLCQEHDVSALLRSLPARLAGLFEVAGNIPHDRVELREGENNAVRSFAHSDYISPVAPPGKHFLNQPSVPFQVTLS